MKISFKKTNKGTMLYNFPHMSDNKHVYRVIFITSYIYNRTTACFCEQDVRFWYFKTILNNYSLMTIEDLVYVPYENLKQIYKDRI